MILQSEHVHHDGSLILAKNKSNLQFDAGKETQEYFQNQLTLSQQRIRKKLKNHKLIIKEIKTLQQISERKIYTGLQNSYADYLLILLNHRKQKLGKELPIMENAIQQKERKVIKDIRSKSLNIETNVKSLDLIKKELDQKLQIMRTKNPQIQLSKEDQEAVKLKEQQKRQNYLQFRQREHWKMSNEKNRSAVVFVKQMKEKGEKQRERYYSLLEQSKMELKSKQEAKIMEMRQLHKRERNKLHQNYQKEKEQRQNEKEQSKKKEKEARNFIMKYASKIPAHIAFLEKQNKQETEKQSQREEFLQSIKESKKHESLIELKQSLKQFQQYQLEHSRQLRKQQFKEREKQEEIHQKLEKLYKSNFYSRVQQQQKIVLPDERKAKHQKIMKMLMYSQRAQSEHTPKIDESLRSELLHQIEQQAKRQNKLQKIATTGEVILFTKDELNPKQIGLSYLKELKQMNKLIKKNVSVSSHQPEGIKIKDKSLEKHVNFKVNRTISNWKRLFEGDKLSTPQKQAILKNYFILVQEESMRAAQTQKKSSLAKSIDIQRKVDHYQMQKAKAKLALLKSLK